MMKLLKLNEYWMKIMNKFGLKKDVLHLINKVIDICGL